jgi:uncharacterized C2H2 Zn-finger protein
VLYRICSDTYYTGLKETLEKLVVNDQMVYTAEGVRYKCTQCPRLLKKMAHVKIHMKIHEKNLKCVKCGKMFYYEKKLEDHVDNQYQYFKSSCVFKFIFTYFAFKWFHTSMYAHMLDKLNFR